MDSGTGVRTALKLRGSFRVFVVGEQIVEDSQGGLQVEVYNIWKTKLRIAEIIGIYQTWTALRGKNRNLI